MSKNTKPKKSKPKKSKRQEDEDECEGLTIEECRLERIGARERQEDKNITYSNDPVIQRFFKKHGEFVQDRGHYLFQDGAKIEKTWRGFGLQQEPPEDKWACHKLIAKFFAKKEKAARDKFRDYKDLLVGRGSGYVFESSEEEQEKKLKLLRSKAKKARERLEEAVKEVNDLEPAYLGAKRRMDAETKQKQAAHKARISNINL